MDVNKEPEFKKLEFVVKDLRETLYRKDLLIDELLKQVAVLNEVIIGLRKWYFPANN